MSSIYLDVIKDRYTMKADDERRRRSQYTVYRILKDVIVLLAPILSFTSEEAYGYMPGEKKDTVFLEKMPQAGFGEKEKAVVEKWSRLIEVREAVQKKLEALRADKVIGHSLDSSVKLFWENIPALDEEFEALESIFIVSGVEKAESAKGLEKIEDLNLWVGVREASGEKCPRCWKRRELKDFTEEITGICETCYEAIK